MVQVRVRDEEAAACARLSDAFLNIKVIAAHLTREYISAAEYILDSEPSRELKSSGSWLKSLLRAPWADPAHTPSFRRVLQL